MPNTVEISGKLGKIGFLTEEGNFNQIDLINTDQISKIQLGTQPPYESVSILDGICDSELGRLYILNQK